MSNLEQKKTKIFQMLQEYDFIHTNNTWKKLNVTIELTTNNLKIKDQHNNIFYESAIENIEENILTDRIAWIIEIPHSFNELQYATDNPQTKEYYQPWAQQHNIPERRRLFHHYFLYTQHRSPSTLQNTNSYANQENLTIKHSGIHVFAYEDSSIEDVMFRQNIAIQSYQKHKIQQIKIVTLAKKDPKISNITYHKIEDINYNSTKCDRDYYYLGSALQYALSATKKNDYIIYTNSDCYIKNDFYNYILSSDYDYIEFFRVEVDGKEAVGHNKDGIDGFAIKNQTLTTLIDQNILPTDLILGAPYWDAIFSSVARKYIRNKYQDTSRLYHTKHKPRWSFKGLDYGGQHNLDILNKLSNNNIINCRKAEIKSDNLVIRIFNENTDFTKVKNNIFQERFSHNKIKNFDYNYLFIEQKNDNLTAPSMSDESLGTTAGTRYIVPANEIEQILDKEKKLYNKYILLDDDNVLHQSTKFISSRKNPRLGIVLAFFGKDQLRIEATYKAIDQLKKQSIWPDCSVVFVELLDIDNNSVFNFADKNIIHIKVQINPYNMNLFQKECLWNIGAKKILDIVDNIIFIDADTYSQDKMLFSRINRLLYKNSHIVYQLGNCIITMQDDNTITRVQWLWSEFSKMKASNPYCFGPCGGFALSKEIFNKINGFNPYGFLYGGDILFLYEIDNRSHSIYNWAMKNMNIFREMSRSIDNNNIVVKNAQSPLIHCWHGTHESRPYHVWGMVFNELNFSKTEIKIDENGLLAWSDINALQKYANFFANKHKITNIKDCKRLYS